MKRTLPLFLLIFFVALAINANAYHYVDPPSEGWTIEQNSSEVSHAIGTVFSMLPDGARAVEIEGVQYFFTNHNWFRPVMADGIKYVVVFAPV